MSAQTKEYKVKAAYLYNFTRYVSGMDSSNGAGGGAFVIGVLGENPFGNALTKIAASKTAQGKPIRIQEFASFADYNSCDILFVSGQVSDEVMSAIVRQTDRQPVLVVAESPGFCELGRTINFQQRPDGRLGIEINIDAVGRRQLVVDAKLMKLATIVRDAE